MKKCVMVVILVAAALSLMAQTSVSEPDFDGIFFALDGVKLLPLERQTATIQAGAGGFMVASAKAAYVVPGVKSSVRFHADQPLDFVVRIDPYSKTVDPSTLYVLRRLDSKKKNREIVFSSGHFSPVGGSMSTNLAQGSVPVTFARYGESSIRITAGILKPGEYALSRAYGQDLFCFGVD